MLLHIVFLENNSFLSKLHLHTDERYDNDESINHATDSSSAMIFNDPSKLFLKQKFTSFSILNVKICCFSLKQ